MTKNHLVFTSAPDAEVSRFGPGQILPDVHTHQVDVDHIGHESAELDGEVELDGGTPVTNCELQIGKTPRTPARRSPARQAPSAPTARSKPNRPGSKPGRPTTTDSKRRTKKAPTSASITPSSRPTC